MNVVVRVFFFFFFFSRYERAKLYTLYVLIYTRQKNKIREIVLFDAVVPDKWDGDAERG